MSGSNHIKQLKVSLDHDLDTSEELHSPSEHGCMEEANEVGSCETTKAEGPLTDNMSSGEPVKGEADRLEGSELSTDGKEKLKASSSKDGEKVDSSSNAKSTPAQLAEAARLCDAMASTFTEFSKEKDERLTDEERRIRAGAAQISKALAGSFRSFADESS